MKNLEINHGVEYDVEYEWVVRATISVKAGSEAEAMAHELTQEEVNRLIETGEYAKGSMEAVAAWIKEEEE